MFPKRKRQSNFICDPEGPWGPVYDSSFQNDSYITKYRFIDFRKELINENEQDFRTIQRLHKSFTQIKDSTN